LRDNFARWKKVNFTGTDTLRVAGGKLVEYWLNADSLLLAQQLEYHPVGS
jgi:hypothetical protein